jgi:hypothetical protein
MRVSLNAGALKIPSQSNFMFFSVRRRQRVESYLVIFLSEIFFFALLPETKEILAKLEQIHNESGSTYSSRQCIWICR